MSFAAAGRRRTRLDYKVGERPRWRRWWWSPIALLTPLFLVAQILAVTPAWAQVADDNPCNDQLNLDSNGRPLQPRVETVVQVDPTGAICQLEQQVVAEIAADRGVPLNSQTRREILTYGGAVVRDRLFARLIDLATRDRNTLSAVEDGALAWLDARVRGATIDAAHRSTDEYNKWKAEPCDYVAPAGFEYEAKACADEGGLLSTFVKPSPPSYNEFLAYGLAGVMDNVKSASNKEAMERMAVVGVTSAVIGAAAFGIPIGLGLTLATELMVVTFGLTLLNTVGPLVFPAVAAEVLGYPSAAVAAVLAPSAVAVVGILVIFAVITALAIAELVEEAKIPDKLADWKAFAESPIPQQTKFSLMNETLKPLVFASFMESTLPDHAAPASIVPAATPPANAPWFRTDATLTGTAPVYSQRLQYIDSADGEHEAWLVDKWWVTRPLDGSKPPRLTPYLKMIGPRGPVVLSYDGTDFIAIEPKSEPVTGCPGRDCTIGHSFNYGRTLEGSSIPAFVRSRLSGAQPKVVAPVVVGPAPSQGAVTVFQAKANDPDGDPLTFRWDIVTDGKVVRRYTGAEIKHTFAISGDYTVRVTALDPTGLSDSAELAVPIAGTPPVVRVRTVANDTAPLVGAPLKEGTAGGFIAVSGSPGDIIDIDAENDGFMDGSKVVGAGQDAVVFPAPLFPDEGSYPVRVSILEPDGDRTDDVAEVEVANVEPSHATVVSRIRSIPLPGGGQEIVLDPIPVAESGYLFPEGSTISVSSQVSDPGDDSVDLLVRWGDRTSERFFAVDQREGAGAQFAHTFTDDTERGVLSGLLIGALDEDGLISVSTRGEYLFKIINVPPTIDNFDVAVTGARAMASLTVSDAVPDDIESAVVDWGDGTSTELVPQAPAGPGHIVGQSASLTAAHAYGRAGTYTVTLTVRDDAIHSEHWAVSTRTITTTGPAPEFVSVRPAAGPLGAQEKGLILRTADPDADGVPAIVDADWGDGVVETVPYDAVASAHVARHTYNRSGVFAVRFTARDQHGNQARPLSGSLTIANFAPTLVVGSAPASVPEGSPVVITGQVQDGPVEGASVGVNWGDGTAVQTVAAAPDGSFTATRSFTDDAVRTVTLTPVDQEGLAGSAVTHTVTVANVRPMITATELSAASVLPHESVTVRATFTDPGTDTHTLGVVWGDGSASGPAAATSPATAAHTYTAPGDYAVAVTVTDDNAGAATSQVTVKVRRSEAAAADLVTALQAVLATAPAASTAAITSALGQLDGPGNGDAVGALASGDLKQAATKLRNAIEALVSAQAQGAAVGPQLQATVALLQSVARTAVASAGAGDKPTALASARQALASGEAAALAGRWTDAANAFRDAVSLVS